MNARMPAFPAESTFVPGRIIRGTRTESKAAPAGTLSIDAEVAEWQTQRS